MRRYNFIRPLLLVAIALLTNSMVTNLCIVFGMEKEMAGNFGFIAMIGAAIIVYTRMQKNRRNK